MWPSPRRSQDLRHQLRGRPESVYRTGDLTATKVSQAGGGPHGARPTPDGRAIIVANLTARTVDVIDTGTDTGPHPSGVGGSPVQVAVSPDSQFVFVSLSDAVAVEKIVLRTGKVTARARVSAAPA